jgi:sialidase-1
MNPERNTMRLRLTAAALIAVVLVLLADNAVPDEVTFEVVGKEPPAKRSASCRRMIVGPWVNQPEEYPGYNGFVGWAGITRLRSGRWIMTFTSGTWHVTVPWTDEIRKDLASRKQFEEWQNIGLPDIAAPRGGRAHIMFSDDQGLTWSKPKLLVDTPDDDRHPTILELDDGTLLCTFFTYRLPRVHNARYMLSHEDGKTWTAPKDLPGQKTAFGNGSAIQLADGTVLCVCEGIFDKVSGQEAIGTLRSTDHGRTFKLASIVKADHRLNEPTVVETAPGKLMMVIRREGDMCFSDDGGKTWEQTGSKGWNLFDPHLIRLPSGVLALFHGSYTAGGIRVFLSPDGGHTWHGPGKSSGKPYGYSVDRSVYGYSHPMLLPDGTISLVYLNSGGHHPASARTQAIWGLRVNVHDDAQGIDILPAPGSPAATVRKPGAGNGKEGGDPKLGDKF